MMFRATIIALVATMASAKSFLPSNDIAANSELGNRLLKSATVVKEARHLEQGDRDVTFIANYNLKYLGCSSLASMSGEGGGGDEGVLYTQHLVRFALCPDSCSSCANGGEYVVNMMEFVDTYTESILEAQEYACEMVRENCYCDNANDDDVCEAQCYATAGLDYCIEYEGQEAFEIQEYLECAELEQGENNGYNGYNGYNGNNNNNNNNNNGNNNNGQVYYVGPTCSTSDGMSIHLHVFSDETCTQKASNSIYADMNYGTELPFATEPIVPLNGCVSCLAVSDDDDGNNNNNNGYNGDLEPTELCEQSYESAARCEKSMDIYYQDNTGCNYINNILPRISNASRSALGGGSGTAAVVFAWLFGISTIVFGAYAYFLYRKIKRGSVSLSGQSGSMA